MKKLLFFSFLLLFGWIAQAQDRVLTGTVKGEDGDVLPGVSIQIRGTSRGTTTDTDGKYQISLPSSSVSLTFSYVGFATQTLSVGNQTTLDVTLKVDAGSLNEVVVTGYGVREVKDLTGAIGRISGNQVASIPTSSFDRALAGKTAGLQVSSTGGLLGDGVAIRIRGINSISNSSLPLIVIDGIPSNTRENLNTFNSGNGTRFNPLALVNPNDIESIEVLKDAAAAVLYGSRAANGVILITTKKGKRGVSRISVDSKITWARPSRNLKLLNGDEFNAIQNEKAANRFGASSPNAVIAKDSDIDGDGRPDRVNWLDEVYRTGLTHDNTVSMSGGSEKATYYGSVRYSDQEGIAVGNRLKTGSVRLNIDVTPHTWIKSGIQFSYNKALNNGILSDRYLAGITVAGLNAFPTISPYNADGSYNLVNGYLGLGNNLSAVSGTQTVANRIFNPLAAVALQRNNNTAQSLVGNVYVDIKPIPSLTLTSKFGIDYLTNFEDQYSNPLIAGLGASYNGLVQDNLLTRNLWTWQNYANFDQTFAEDHRITAGVGIEYQYVKEQQLYTGASNFADPFYTSILDGLYTSESGGTNLVLTGGGLLSNGLKGIFGRLSYTYKDRYSVEALYRTDEYSGFGANSRVGKFPSVSAGWTMSQEEFIKNIEWINYLKIRGSYGVVGNSRGIGSYAARTLYGGGQYANLNGFGLFQAGNPNLKWESSKKTNVAVESRFLNDRFGLTVEYFYNNITDLVLNAPVLHTVGVPNSTVTTNIGSMYNRGFEFTLNTSIIKTKDLDWNVSVNFTTLKNRVTQLGSDGADIIDTETSVARASVGRVLGTYNMIRWAGVDPQTGNPSWLDKNGVRKFFDFTSQKWILENGEATTAIGGGDQVYIEGKSGLPTLYGGLNSRLTYKGIDFGFNFTYTGGFYIYNSTRAGLMSNYLNNNLAEIKDRWTTPGQVTDVPRLYFGVNTPNQASTRFLEKGDFLRLQDVSIGYDLKTLLGERLPLERLRIYGQVYNAFVLTKYKGADPEINSNRNNTNIAIGVDNRSVPQPRIVTLGVNLSF